MSTPGTATDDAAAGAVFAALADPTRRRIVRALADGQAVTASSLAAGLPVTRQAVAKHLAALRTAGLAVTRARGARDALPPHAGPLHRRRAVDGQRGRALGRPPGAARPPARGRPLADAAP